MELKPVTVTLNNTERITLNKCKERQDEVRLLRLYHKLRMYSSHNAFARECLEYYIKITPAICSKAQRSVVDILRNLFGLLKPIKRHRSVK